MQLGNIFKIQAPGASHWWLPGDKTLKPKPVTLQCYMVMQVATLPPVPNPSDVKVRGIGITNLNPVHQSRPWLAGTMHCLKVKVAVASGLSLDFKRLV